MAGGPADPVKPDAADGPWGSLLPEETGFVAFWPGTEPPQLEEVVAAVRDWLGVEERRTKIGEAAPDGEADEDDGADGADGDDEAEEEEEEEEEEVEEGEEEDDDEVDGEDVTGEGSADGLEARQVEMDSGGALWGMQLTIPSLRAGVILWAEEASPLGDPERAMLGPEASACRWVIRAQTVLAAKNAPNDYFMLASLLGGSLVELVGILDVITSQYFPRKRLEQLFLASDATPIDHVLWRLGRFDSPDGSSTLLVTTGLRRCGLPELELLDLPIDRAQAGVVLMQTLASLLLEGDMPEPDVTLEIGDQVAVSLRRSSIVAREMRPTEVGSRPWRERMQKLGVERFLEESAVVSPPRVGSTANAPRYPATVIEAIEAGTAVLYISTNEAASDLRRAQATFSTFATAFASLHRRDHPDWSEIAERSFLVQAPLDESRESAAAARQPALVPDPVSPADEDDRVEQVWLEVRAIERAGVRGALAASPRSRPDLHVGTELVVPATHVTNWRVEFPDRAFGPAESDDLLVEIDRLRGFGGGSPRSPS